MMVSYKDLKVSDYEIGLTKLIGKQVKEIRGYLSGEFGDPCFKLTQIEFEDGTFLGCEGEHDIPYLVSSGRDNQPNYDEETLQRLYDEQDED